MTAFRVYAPDELGRDGYPPEWHETIKHAVREEAGHRCVRCGHPYRSGENPLVREVDDAGREVFASWSPCDERCRHGGPVRVHVYGRWIPTVATPGDGEGSVQHALSAGVTQARWRILTVHHLDMNKANCRWWNLAALCQRCHLEIQLKVHMRRRWLLEHSDWFKPYVAGFYAWTFLNEDLTRVEVEARLHELLALEDRQLALSPDIGGSCVPS